MNKRSVVVGGLRMNVLESGPGTRTGTSPATKTRTRTRLGPHPTTPHILLLHGIPDFSHTWRHQLRDLAAAGYHVLAPDLRGCGETARPDDVEQYSLLHLVGDVVGLLDAFRIEHATVVGHGWGSVLAWNTALMRADRVREVVGVGVPYMPRGEVSLLTAVRERFGDQHYLQYFQKHGPADRELARDVAATFRRVLSAGSEQWDPVVPEGGGWLDCLPDKGIPEWLDPADLDAYVATFARTGFTGALNWYRNLERNHELTAAWYRAPIPVPALFIHGTRDAFGPQAFSPHALGPHALGPHPLGPQDAPAPHTSSPHAPAPHALGPQDALGPSTAALTDDLATLVPDLRSVVRLAAGHWVHQERPDEVTAALVDFLERDRQVPRVRDLTC